MAQFVERKIVGHFLVAGDKWMSQSVSLEKSALSVLTILCRESFMNLGQDVFWIEIGKGG